jgi:2-polyprenyl-3-methyl-5-hydroxy-6-metoxy-1,4-benzoquinol methylase
MIISPLTNSQDVSLLKEFTSDQLIFDWKSSFNIDISQELQDCETIFLYQCNKSKLRFFSPLNIAGSDKLYEQLEKFEWYYMPRKWEHDVAIKDLTKSAKILEIGCGKGAFIQRLCQEENKEAYGIELNNSAVKFAQNADIPVSLKDVNELAEEQPNSFDAVCCFQVLEHISNLKPFLESMIQLVKPNGKIIISVPNYLSFTKHCKNNLLDQPPHHMSQWSIESFKYLTKLFPIQLENYHYEPLADYHVDWYLSIQLSRMPKVWLMRSVIRRLTYRFAKLLLKNNLFLRKLINGHTIYVCFSKTS